MAVITLTTDFGIQDWFVGTMKGVIFNLQPQVNVVDITHGIAPGDIRAGAFALAASYRFFPKGTVHVVVVDPGVGSVRKAIAAQTANYFFVGPDNGVLSWALAREQLKAVHALENEHYFLQHVSRTFHGRDIFAPVAAHLSRGLPLRKLGPAQESFTRLDWPTARVQGRGVHGEILYLDRFGNALTNIDAETLRALGPGAREVRSGRKCLCSIAEFYQAVPRGQAVAVLGSSGYLEIAINGGNAAQDLGLKVGSSITVTSVPRSDSHGRRAYGL